MSLRFRLLGSIIICLFLALAFGGTLVCRQADKSVQVEMQAALAGAEDVINRELGRPDDSYATLVASFNGQRHVHVTLLDNNGKVLAASKLAHTRLDVPDWFGALITTTPQAIIIPLHSANATHASFLIETDPRNEIGEVWEQTRDAFVTMGLFCSAVFVVMFLFGRYFLRFFGELDHAFERVANGEYETQITERGPSEFTALAHGFNCMAERLKAYREGNQQLQEQLLKLQEEERADIARDLHDEVGPYLFAINVDTDAILRLSKDESRQIREHGSAIREAVSHIQKHVKAILRQLRPVDRLDFGLETAIADLVAFWTRRNPRLRFACQISLGGIDIDRRSQEVAYRIIQESVSNAVQHGRPRIITIVAAATPEDQISLTITDDGAGLPSLLLSGMGLIGMSERVRSLGGRFDMESPRETGGVIIKATIPFYLSGSLKGIEVA